MPESIQASWQRIELWLRTHYSDAIEALQAGAAEAEISRVEWKIGVTFPDDFRESLKIHNGGVGASILPSASESDISAFSLLPVAEIAQRWASWKSRNDSGDLAGSGIGDPWHDAWVPFSTNAGDDDQVLNRNVEDPKFGCVLQLSHVTCDRSPLFENFASLLSTVAKGMQDGKYIVLESWGVVDKHHPHANRFSEKKTTMED